MIKFFRHIRQSMINQNRTKKYLLYAIGEIVLVVIGILIALQINNWNDERKTKNLEEKILKELHVNLSMDLEELQDDVSYMDNINSASLDVREFIKNNEFPNDSIFKVISILRVTPHFDPNKSGYQLLQSKGVEVISNDSLRNDISLLYERSYPYYKRYEEERLRFHALHSEPLLLKYFTMQFNLSRKYYGDFKISQEDYNKIRTDDAFLKLLSAIAFENAAVQNRGEGVIKNIESLLNSIEKELSD
ncbi:DUF6090 family protein [Winogradskyella ouciana]|uniref:Uncharacterized protein n=1 Tax=Winogradskyella ouciana TaxID=2608631 RepID=A0A7K1GFF9_9FLAO|nr:DUF6090 family protein [Winogradskyella ouciana]MTE27853.1 hypothetical protein [Winogradskyella ouciana]